MFLYIFYTFFKNLQEMEVKPPWCLFEMYHMYVFIQSLCENTYEMLFSYP